MQYAASGGRGIIFEIQQGLVDRGCDVAWRPVDGGFDGAMADPGGCVVLSQRDGTTRVRVKDALALRDDVLEVDDRGYALDGTLLYGSPDGGPYRLARVQGTRDQGGDP